MKLFTIFRKNKLAAVCFWLVVWQLLAAAVDTPILFASPLETLSALGRLLWQESFYASLGRSALRIGAGFLLGFFGGVLLAAAGMRFEAVQRLLSPLMRLATAVPVAVFAVLLLIWWGSSFLSVAVSFLVVLPNSYGSMLEGLKSTDRKMVEMAQVFRLPFASRLFYIYRPAVKPFLQSSLKLSLGMCWKSGVAAEVIGIPQFSVGERLYLAKLYLDTAEVLAWAVVILAASFLLEKLTLRLADLFFAWQPACAGSARAACVPGELRAEGLCKSFDGKKVLEDVSQCYRAGEIYYLRQPSGSGKTTLLTILAGIWKPDAGSVAVPGAAAMLFQEDRLCETCSAVKNVELVCGSAVQARAALEKLLEPEALGRPCASLSGGMKRRVALARAMEAQAAYVLLDEPFAGMDEATRDRAMQYILERQRGRCIIIATHI